MDEPQTNIDFQVSPQFGFEEATTFSLIVFFALGHGDFTQMSFCPRIPTTLEAHNFVCQPPIEIRSEEKL
jgi:hypothetical protein